MSKKSTVITIRVPDELAAKIASAVKKTGRDQSDILREAVGIGMADLELIGFDPVQIAREKIAAIKAERSTPLPTLSALPDSVKKSRKAK